MNLAQAIDPRSGLVDNERVRTIQMSAPGCGYTVAELLTSHLVSVRVHERQGPAGQGKHPNDP